MYGCLYAFLVLCACYASEGDEGDAVVDDVAGDAVYVDAYVLSYHDLFH